MSIIYRGMEGKRVFNEKPPHVEFKVQVVGCFLEYEDKFLLLHRQDNVPQGNLWCTPGGKLEKSEMAESGAIRETREETGFDISRLPIFYVGQLFVLHPHLNYIYHMVRCKPLDGPEVVKIQFRKHKGFTWVNPSDALKMALHLDEDHFIKHVYPELQVREFDVATSWI